MSASLDKLRIDRWLWAARFYKTRSLASREIGRGRVSVNGQLAKPATEVGRGDEVKVRKEGPPTVVWVRDLSAVRGPASVAQHLYEETPDSIAARERAREMRRLAPEPAHSIRDGRPTKLRRRQIERWRGREE